MQLLACSGLLLKCCLVFVCVFWVAEECYIECTLGYCYVVARVFLVNAGMQSCIWCLLGGY